MHAIVTGYFDINRHKWAAYSRAKQVYFNNAKRLFKTPEPMIVFVPEEYKEFVIQNRDPKYTTYIIITDYSELKYAPFEERIRKIMMLPSYRVGLVEQTAPEHNIPQYNAVIWSKIDLVCRAAKMFPQYSHFAWVDFGIHPHILLEYMLGKPIYQHGVTDLIKLHCRSLPQPSDMDIQTFFKSHINRFAAGSITGNRANFEKLQVLLDTEIKHALSKNVVDSEQSFYAVIFNKNPELFELSYGDWGQIFVNYYVPDPRLVERYAV